MSSVDDKIRKLLAIAECESATDAERELALEKAAALADRHAIDMASLGSAADSFGTTVVYLARSRPAWVLPVAVVLQLFNVRAVFSTVNTEHGRFKTVSLFGSQSSRRVGEYVFTFLRREFLRRCSLYEAELKAKAVACRLVTNDWRMSSAWKGEYYRGLAAGLFQKLDAKRNSGVAGRQLVKVSAELDSAFASAFPNAGELKTRANTASSDGIRDGASIELNDALAAPSVRRIAN